MGKRLWIGLSAGVCECGKSVAFTVKEPEPSRCPGIYWRFKIVNTSSLRSKMGVQITEIGWLKVDYAVLETIR